MKRLILLLTFIVKIYCAESEMPAKPELHYLEKINYISTAQFNDNIQQLLNQNENDKKIALCLQYLYMQIMDLKYALNGAKSQTKYLSKQVCEIEQALNLINK